MVRRPEPRLVGYVIFVEKIHHDRDCKSFTRRCEKKAQPEITADRHYVLCLKSFFAKI